RYAVDLPERGMAIGARFVGDGFTATGDVWFLLNARRSLVRFQVRPTTEGAPEEGLTFSFSRATVDIADDTVPLEVAAPVERHVELPAAGERRYLSFEEDALVVEHA